jgi:hypothetical protein
MRAIGLGIGLLMPACAIVCARAAEGGGEIAFEGISLSSLPSARSLVVNGGFEALGPSGFPVGWLWDRRNTDATCVAIEGQARNGRRCLRFTSSTPFGAHVYGSLWSEKPVRLEPGKTYALSARVSSSEPGAAWIGGGAGWRLRAGLPATGDSWRTVVLIFTAGPDEADFVPRVNVDSETPGILVDDVRLEEGAAATPPIPEGGRLDLEPIEGEATLAGDGPFRIGFRIAPGRAAPGADVEVSLDRDGPSLRRSIDLASVLNLRNDAVEVALSRAGATVRGKDLIRDEDMAEVSTFGPLEFRLIRFPPRKTP